MTTRSIRTLLIALLLLAAGLSAAGCASGQRTSDVTDGYRIELFVRSDRTSFSRFLVEPNGMLSFAGGIDAQVARYSWSGPMTDDELVRLRAILEEHGGFRKRPTAADRAMDVVEYNIKVRGLTGQWRHTVTGRSADLEPLRELLSEAASRRNEEILDRLPKADGP